MTSADKKPIRVRMAPSPTGNLHIGTARTALFNVLFARAASGTIVLRMEDTDVARSTKESEQDILSGFKWLGIQFDEGVMPDGSEKGEFGPYRQMQRLESYAQYLQQLLTEHKAYYCFCSKEELEAQRQSLGADGQAPKYNGKCRSLTELDMMKNLAEGKAAVIRFKVPPEKIKIHDIIRGSVEFDNALGGDIVIAKSLKEPLYNFAVVVDDYQMQITHVIRGDDHLANTPKQVAIGQALGFPLPEYAHLPVILSATGKGKMSKRDGGTSIKEYRDAGYLPQAMINFLALLGWHPTGDREVLEFIEIVKEFSLERVQKGGAKFDKEKLDYFNQHYLKQLPPGELARLLVEGGFSDPQWGAQMLERVIPLVSERMIKLGDFKESAGFFFTLPEYAASILAWKKSTPAGAAENLQRCVELLKELPDQLFTFEALEPKIMALANPASKGDLLWPLRVAVSGKEASPPPIPIIAALGKSESLRRIEIALTKLQAG